MPLRIIDLVLGCHLRLKNAFLQYGKSFSFVGLVFAALFFSASVTPSLLPRWFLFQGLLSGLAIAVGYGIGVIMRGIASG